MFKSFNRVNPSPLFDSHVDLFDYLSSDITHAKRVELYYTQTI